MNQEPNHDHENDDETMADGIIRRRYEHIFTLNRLHDFCICDEAYFRYELEESESADYLGYRFAAQHPTQGMGYLVSYEPQFRIWHEDVGYSFPVEFITGVRNESNSVTLAHADMVDDLGRIWRATQVLAPSVLLDGFGLNFKHFNNMPVPVTLLADVPEPMRSTLLEQPTFDLHFGTDNRTYMPMWIRNQVEYFQRTKYFGVWMKVGQLNNQWFGILQGEQVGPDATFLAELRSLVTNPELFTWFNHPLEVAFEQQLYGDLMMRRSGVIFAPSLIFTLTDEMTEPNHHMVFLTGPIA